MARYHELRSTVLTKESVASIMRNLAVNISDSFPREVAKYALSYGFAALTC